MSVGQAIRFAFTESRGVLKRGIAYESCISPYGRYSADIRGETTVAAGGLHRYQQKSVPKKGENRVVPRSITGFVPHGARLFSFP